MARRELGDQHLVQLLAQNTWDRYISKENYWSIVLPMMGRSFTDGAALCL